MKKIIQIKLEEAILVVQGLKLELRKTDMEIDKIILDPLRVFELLEKIILFNHLKSYIMSYLLTSFKF